ncbi:hypothetical protein COS66_02385 [Candidatus Berkelbacteria bacterium CG06_land_8_20_14_3_00_43_10]|uniref:Uncharacterized protein n=1 Tax=Candidatus Berkelbacteria bacterium CG10_big_fil_rev_8_21_14_0_10_43_14 TaxID=1974515 RepID=A0A2M6R9P4_9BACT|nr:MAG: hypothetical protein AUK41_02735 [Candidatus Berkelbacteria bacterium CG2_30_43_20]PIS07207.1 MAG: hypothetical protein COT79_00480 [Candidatus Berkelbacteria bacterium CG10_big_fil_rev_8_21_14_0_10_43_14]PIU87154.1 MAG: hypothetical protein COS66_02385 [Candidatus Berkelbacteria bacterium CG06_land_8_20_14_3_00_43_10]
MIVWYFLGVWLVVFAVAMVTGMYWNSKAVRANLTALKAFGYVSTFAFCAMLIICVVYQDQMRWYEQLAGWLIGLFLGSPFSYGIISVASQNTANDDQLEVIEKGLIWNALSCLGDAMDYLSSDTPAGSVSVSIGLDEQNLCKNSWVIMAAINFFPIICLLLIAITAVIKAVKVIATIIGCAFGWYIHWDWRKLVLDPNDMYAEFTSLWKKQFCPIQPLLVLGTTMFFMNTLHTPASSNDLVETSRWLLIFALSLGVNIMLVANVWVARYIEKKEREMQERISKQTGSMRPHSRTYDRAVSFVVAPILLCDREMTSIRTRTNRFADDAKQRCVTFWRVILDFKDRACPTIK